MQSSCDVPIGFSLWSGCQYCDRLNDPGCLLVIFAPHCGRFHRTERLRYVKIVRIVLTAKVDTQNAAWTIAQTLRTKLVQEPRPPDFTIERDYTIAAHSAAVQSAQ